MGILTALCLGSARARAGTPAYQYEILALLGTKAPGGGALRGAFKPGVIGDGGEVLYSVGIGSRGAEGLFLDTPDVVVAVAEPGAEAADGWQFAEEPGALGGIDAPAAMNRAGDLVFAADISRGGQPGSGVFRWEGATGALTALALPGRTGPGAITFGNASPGAAITDDGAVLFSMATGPMPAPDGSVIGGVFQQTGNDVRPIALPGDPAPGGGTVLGAGRPSANNRGQIAFEAEITRDSRLATAVFLSDGTRLRSLAAPGVEIPTGEMLREAQGPRLNDRGQVAFFGNAGTWAIYLWEDGQVTRVAGPGSALPFGARAQTVVTGEGSLALNQQGTVAMVLALEEPAARGVFLGSGGALTAVALPGTFLAGVGPIDDVGEHLALGNDGQVAFQAELADGDVALVLATPVPSGG